MKTKQYITPTVDKVVELAYEKKPQDSSISLTSTWNTAEAMQIWSDTAFHLNIEAWQ